VGFLSEHLVIDSIPVELRRNRRRRTRIGIDFDPAGVVVLDAPVATTLADVQAMVAEHGRWIRYRLQKIKESTAHLGRVHYVDGDIVQYLGDNVTLRVIDDDGSAVYLADGRLCVAAVDADDARQKVRAWYQLEADRVFADALIRWCDLPWLADRPPVWRHSFMKTQWGSCSETGRISLNTHLVKTPIELVEYVVLHELCHLRYLDHGRRFYGLMTSHLPGWEIRRKDLDKYMPLLLEE
jgi:hypothetical protein